MEEYRVFHTGQRRMVGRYPNAEQMMIALAKLVRRDPEYRQRLSVIQTDADGNPVGRPVPVQQLDLLQWTSA